MTAARIAVLCIFIFPRAAHSGALLLGPGLGLERINDTFNVDLKIIRGLYRFDSGITIGGVAMFGYVDFLDIPDEVRYEAIIGYTTVSPRLKLAPYVFLSKGLRSYFSSQNDVNYHTATVGSRYNFNERLYFDGSYRYRNTKEISWESNLYSIGLGYNFSNSFTVQINIGRTLGDYRSEQASVAFISRF